MSRVEIINTEISMVIETELHADAEDIRVMDLFLKLKEWGTQSALAEINLTRDVSDPQVYSYLVEKKDLRQVLVTYRFGDGHDTDPLLEIALSPGWLASEMAFGGLVRAAMIAVRVRFGIVSMEVEYP